MVAPLAMMGASLAIEIIRFAMTTKGLEGKTPEEVYAVWAKTNAAAKAVHDEWDAQNSG